MNKTELQKQNFIAMKTIAIVTVLLITANICFSQSLWINDPQTWRGGQGTIEETKITYEPQGIFMHVDWEITFSARGLSDFSETDTVEVVYNFNLPEGSVINDSWLWFEDTILNAMILDRWSASQVYENIVNRRRDPSILTKNWGNNYELRVYPMAAKETRKVKISFLTPLNWTQKSVSTPFLSANLMVSKNAIENIDVFAKLSSEWKNPILTGLNQIPLDAGNFDPEVATHHIKIQSKQLANDQKLELNAPLNNGYYLSFFEQDNEKFYQLALYPAEGINIRTPQKVIFLVDYQKENSKLSQAELIKLFAGEMTELLNEKDSFNVLFHDFELQMAGSNWIPGDSSSIYSIVESLGENPFVSYSNLATLLASGIEYAQTQPGSKIVLLANSDRIDDVESANTLIEDLLKLMDPKMPIYIADYQTENYNYSWVKNVNYRGNEYFYRNLAKLTGGDYCNSFDGETFSGLVKKIYELATNELGLIDIHTTLDNGLCYGRYILSPKNQNALTNIYLETGRYSGEFPFEIEVSGLYSDEIFSKKLSITKEAAIETDSLAGIFWYGKEIMEMENSNNSYSLINDIIDKSIENRILSNYTAFLCLEPSMMGELDNIDDKNVITRGWEGDVDGQFPISAEKIETIKTDINVYPNPFTERVNVEIKLQDALSEANTQLEIYDLFGKRIKVFNAEEFNGETEIRISWNGTDISGNKVPKGTYLFICTTPQNRISRKLVFM